MGYNLIQADVTQRLTRKQRSASKQTLSVRFVSAMYEMIHEKEGIHRLYEGCYRDNLHSIWVNQELYRKGNTQSEFYNILEKNMKPVYDSARRQGYDVWEKQLAI